MLSVVTSKSWILPRIWQTETQENLSIILQTLSIHSASFCCPTGQVCKSRTISKPTHRLLCSLQDVLACRGHEVREIWILVDPHLASLRMWLMDTSLEKSVEATQYLSLGPVDILQSASGVSDHLFLATIWHPRYDIESLFFGSAHATKSTLRKRVWWNTESWVSVHFWYLAFGFVSLEPLLELCWVASGRVWECFDDAVPFFLCVSFASLRATGEIGFRKALLDAVLVDATFQDHGLTLLGTKHDTAHSYKTSSIRKAVCIGHHPPRTTNAVWPLWGTQLDEGRAAWLQC